MKWKKTLGRAGDHRGTGRLENQGRAGRTGDRDHNSGAGDHVGAGGTGNSGKTMMALKAMKKRRLREP